MALRASFPKYLVNSSRNFSRERKRRVFTTGTVRPSSLAVSSIENFSMSRKVKMVRDFGSSFWITSESICRRSLFRGLFRVFTPALDFERDVAAIFAFSRLVERGLFPQSTLPELAQCHVHRDAHQPSVETRVPLKLRYRAIGL